MVEAAFSQSEPAKGLLGNRANLQAGKRALVSDTFEAIRSSQSHHPAPLAESGKRAGQVPMRLAAQPFL